MARYLNLQVPSSCKENWNDMRPDEHGRYCFSCQKSVVDFTEMTDQEIVNYFKSHKGSTCGRFTEDQLNKDIAFPRKPLPWIKYFFKFSLPAFLLSLKATASSAKMPVPIEVAPVKYLPDAPDTVGQKVAVSGFIYDNTGTPLPGASVVIKGTNTGTTTNEKGEFTFNHIDLPVTIEVSFVGFMSSELTISSSQQLTNINVKLDPVQLGEVIVGVVITVKSRRKVKEIPTEKQLRKVSSQMIVYPNPVIAGNNINLQCRKLEIGKYVAEFYTVPGQLVKVSKITYDNKGAEVSLPVGELPAGTYFIHLKHEKGKQYTQQIVIRN